MRGWLRAVSVEPCSSTTIHRRSPRGPAISSSIDVIGVPANDFTGKTVSAETTRAGSDMLGP